MGTLSDDIHIWAGFTWLSVLLIYLSEKASLDFDEQIFFYLGYILFILSVFWALWIVIRKVLSIMAFFKYV
jgi:hypothetical protein